MAEQVTPEFLEQLKEAGKAGRPICLRGRKFRDGSPLYSLGLGFLGMEVHQSTGMPPTCAYIPEEIIPQIIAYAQGVVERDKK